MQNIDQLKKIFKKELSSVKSNKVLEQLKIKYLGRNGVINKLFKDIKHISLSEKKELGKKINELKTSMNRFVENKQQELIKKGGETTVIDITLPGKKYPKGSLHLMTLAIEEISHIFEKLGFIRVSYPEVEWEHFAFEALNMPKNHPARDDFETFFIEAPQSKKYGKMILTPHTSSGQVREMQRIKPPIRMINIGKCYRPNWDVTHTPMFYQFEGLCIDQGINITHLKGTIDYFAKEFFGPEREIRLRPHHFQFTEPSFEIDVTCGACDGTGLVTPHVIPSKRNESRDLPKRKKRFFDSPDAASGSLRMTPASGNAKCRLCKSGWMELAGAGMVHPNVLKAGNVNPDIYSGWAFGFGPERCFMMKTGLSDIRDLYSGDIRFLEQF